MVRTPGARLPHMPLEEQQWRLVHAPHVQGDEVNMGCVPPKKAVSQPPCTGGETNGRRRLAKRVHDGWSPETLQGGVRMRAATVLSLQGPLCPCCTPRVIAPSSQDWHAE
jgi:hypothetical protein